MRGVFLPGQYITVPLRQLSSCLVRFSSLYRAFSQTKSKCLLSTKTTAGRCFTPIITIGFFNSQIRFLHLSLQNVISLFSTQHSSTSQSFCHRLHWPFFPALCLSQVEGECHLCLLPTCSQCHLTAQGKSENRDSQNRFTGQHSSSCPCHHRLPTSVLTEDAPSSKLHTIPYRPSPVRGRHKNLPRNEAVEPHR